MHSEDLVSKGITNSVLTIRSKTRVKDIINRILDVKCNAVINWVNSLSIEISRVLIIGIYLTGTGLARRFSNKAIAFDIYPHLSKLVNKFGWVENADLVIDTTGIGGIKNLNVKTKAIVVEDPTSDGSDEIIKRHDVSKRLESIDADYKGVLRTYGLGTKTSGTMTLTLEVLRKSAEDVISIDGVLYAVPAMDYYEGMIFHEKDVNKFLEAIKRPALTVSTLNIIDCDSAINKYLNRIESVVHDWNS